MMTDVSVSVPRLRVETDHERNVFLLHIENADARQEDLMYQKSWNEMPGEVLAWVSHC